MSRKKNVWIPAVLAVIAALLLVAYYLYTRSSHGGAEVRPHPPKDGAGNWTSGGKRPQEGAGDSFEGLFSTMGTIAIYVAAAGFSWFWFKKKRKSPAKLVRQAGRLFHAAHKLLGWLTLLLIAAHGTFFLITKFHDDHIFTGLAAFAILLALAAYGYFIPKVRNKWMRTVHRTLAIVWVPLLWLHAGGSAIIAVLVTLALGGLVTMLHRRSAAASRPIGDR